MTASYTRPGLAAADRRPAKLALEQPDLYLHRPLGRVSQRRSQSRIAARTRPPRELELRHRRRARCEDRIRCAKDTGLTNLPLHDLNQKRDVWCAMVTLACELLAWLQLLTLVGHQARR